MRIRIKRKELARALAAKRLSEEAWARRIGISRSFLNRLLNGRRRYPGAATRRKLLDTLQLDFDELFEYVETASASGHSPAPGQISPRVPRSRPGERTSEMIQHFLRDMYLALRSSRRHPSLAVTTVLTAALGIGITAAMFTLVNGVLLKPLPLDRPEAVMTATETQNGRPFLGVSVPNYLDWRELDEFAALAAVGGSGQINLGQPPRPVQARTVSADYFRALGLTPVVGRAFTAAEEQNGPHRVIVLSESLWNSAFARAPDVAGREVALRGNTYEVIGVVPDLTIPTFGADLYVPLALDGPSGTRRGRRTVSVVGRLADGVSVRQASEALTSLAEALALQYPGTNQNWGAQLEPLTRTLVGDVRQPLLLLFGVVGLLLLISCVNVAGLTLARSLSRSRELGVRSALGASRWRIIQQLGAENLAITAVGGTLGLGAAWLLTDRLLGLLPAQFPRLGEVRFDAEVALFAALVTVVVGLLSGMAPAVGFTRLSAARVVSSGAGSFTDSAARKRLQRGLVVAELALAVILLVGTGLFLRTLTSLVTSELGFRTDDALAFDVRFPADPYEAPEQLRAATDAILQELESAPGVVSATAVTHLPLSGRNMTATFEIQGRTSDQSRPSAGFRIVTPGYFRSMGATLISGRALSRRDRATTPLVVLINESAARTYWPGEDPVGTMISHETRDQQRVWAEIVGVVADLKHFGPTGESIPEIYQPHLQAQGGWRWVGRSLTMVLRYERQGPAAEQIQGTLAQLDGGLRLSNFNELEALLWRTVDQPRLRATLMAGFGGCALLLASVGIYALVSFQLRRQSREIGIRVAIGAPRSRLVGDVVVDSLKLVAMGSILGLAGAWALQSLVASFLFGVTASDPVANLAAPATLAAVVVATTLWPALRATRPDLSTLRSD